MGFVRDVVYQRRRLIKITDTNVFCNGSGSWISLFLLLTLTLLLVHRQVPSLNPRI